MDEWMLNDLLECSVCLERLDTTSKVLPCQHTFCKKCLEEIVSTHKELKCPECRILVDAQIEELPPNVLLMRILEGMKNAGNPLPKKRINTFQKQLAVQNSPQGSPNQPYNNVENNKPQCTQKQNPLPNQPFARAIYDYIPKEAGGLTFRKGDIVYLHRKIDSQWCQGECGGKTGVFPWSFVQVMTPLPNQAATCKALYDFRMVNDEDEGCLSFRKDEVITVIRRVDENWAEGKLNDRIGIFPLAFVEMNNIAQALMKLSLSSQPGPSRVAPPTPTTEESTPLIPTDHSGVISNCVSTQLPTQNNVGNIPYQNSTARTTVTVSNAVSGTESGSTLSSSTSTPSSSSITPNSSSNTSSTSNSAPNSPPSGQSGHNSNPNQNPFLPTPQAPRQMILQTSHITHTPYGVLPTSHIMGQQSGVAPEQPFGDTHCLWVPPQPRNIPNFSQHPKEKRHSFSAAPANSHTCSNSNKHSGEMSISETASDNQNGQLNRHGSQRHRRSGSDLTSAVNLPAGYVALYPYKPQKADELELKKGGIYLVTERCQDGWFKGTSSKTQKSGVFPGNYVTLAKPLAAVQGQPRGTPTRETPTPAPTHKTLQQPKSTKMAAQMYGRQLAPPELPPRASSPSTRQPRIPVQNSSTSWHSSQNGIPTSQKNVGETSSTSVQATPATTGASEARAIVSALAVLNPAVSTPSKSAEKVKDKKEKSGLIKRLTTMKRSKSPPAAASYSMDNPVFDDAPATSQQVQQHPHPVHLRSGSCPSQLIQVIPEVVSNHRNLSGSASARLKRRDRPTINNAGFTQSASRALEGPTFAKTTSSSSHRKSNSLDAGDIRKPRQLVPPVRERFRCIVPYPPNSEYELELKVGDIIYVHKKRDDGWYKGTQQRTGRTGLFPASFVETY